MTPTFDPIRPSALERLRARLSSVDADLAALCLEGLSTDEDAIAFVDGLHDEHVHEAFDARDADRLRRIASGATWRSVVPLPELQGRYGGLLPIHRQHLAVDLLAGHLLKELEAREA